MTCDPTVVCKLADEFNVYPHDNNYTYHLRALNGLWWCMHDMKKYDQADGQEHLVIYPAHKSWLKWILENLY